MDSNLNNQLSATVRDVPDFPKPGILFKDITPVLKDPVLFGKTVEALAAQVEEYKPTAVVGIESRGFLFGAPLALNLGCGLVAVRKPNKLPYQTESVEYALEYGTDSLEIHVDAVGSGDRVIIVDDLLATGGTALATAQLVEKLGAEVVAISCMIELGFLEGRKRLTDYTVHSLLKY